MSENARSRITVSGLVQGVFFRGNTVEQAVSLNLTGWVRNLENGDVEIVAEGEKEKIDKLIGWCHAGPSMARIDSVTVAWEKHRGEFTEFTVEY